MCMIKDWIYKISSLSLWTAFGNLWLRVRYSWANLRIRMSTFWTLTDRTPWIVLGALAVVITTMGLLMINTIDGKEVNRDLTCLALNVYHEARGEPEKGKLAVAKVTLNRVKSSRFPNTICEAVYEQRWDKRRRRYVGAFAWTEFDSLPPPKSKQWQIAWNAAETVYEDPETVQLKGALFYHATRIKPRWAKQKKRIKKIGRHIFYR
ncbi:MAG: cell wall hydrolase [Nitrospinota bacterium]|nr:cell wall hydrolase [Nitrospinota bacterium]